MQHFCVGRPGWATVRPGAAHPAGDSGGRSRRGPVAPLVALAGAAAAAPALAQTPSHCNPSDRNELWCATLTVELDHRFADTWADIIGFVAPDSGTSSPPYGSVAPGRTFTWRGNSFRVDVLRVRGMGQLIFRFGPDRLGSGVFALEVGTGASKRSFPILLNGSRFQQWSDTGLAGAWSAGDSVPVKLVRIATVPGRPASLHAVPNGQTQIDLTWGAPEDGGADITGYRIEVSTDGGLTFRELVATTSSRSTTYSHTGLTPGRTYHYKVKAINSVGTGPRSLIPSATAGAPPHNVNATAQCDATDSNELWCATP